MLMAAVLLAYCITAAPQGQTAQSQSAIPITPVIQPPPVLQPYSVSQTPAAPDSVPPESVLLHRDPPEFGPEPLAPAMASHLLQLRVAMQGRQLQEMVAQLARMAAALQTDAAGTGPETVSAKLVQQVRAIEKLAKKIQGNLQYVPQ
ncbi:MAG: hypothetical protein ACRD01_16325 [Terriglobales bacterium]